MRTLLTSALILAAVMLAGTLSLKATGAQSLVRLTEVMTAEELEETGVMTLTPGQRVALDRWVTLYRARRQ